MLYNAIKWMFVGPPQVGKTTTMYHLLQDLESMQKEKKSTGLEPPIEITFIDSDAVALIDTEDDRSVYTWSGLSVDDLAYHVIHRVESQEESKEGENVTDDCDSDLNSTCAHACDTNGHDDDGNVHVALEETAPSQTMHMPVGSYWCQS